MTEHEPTRGERVDRLLVALQPQVEDADRILEEEIRQAEFQAVMRARREDTEKLLDVHRRLDEAEKMRDANALSMNHAQAELNETLKKLGEARGRIKELVEGREENIEILLGCLDKIYTAATLDEEEKEDYKRIEPEKFLERLRLLRQMYERMKQRVEHWLSCPDTRFTKVDKCSDDPPSDFEIETVEEIEGTKK